MPRDHRGHKEVTPYRPFDFEAANKNYVENIFSEPDMIVAPRSRVGIITCCDARCSPDHFFQLQPNEAFVIRTGGGRVVSTEVIRTLVSIQVLSEIKELRVIHHTDCGSLAKTDEWIKEQVALNDPNAKGGPFRDTALAVAYAEAIAYQPFTVHLKDTERETIDRSVVQDVLYLRTHPLVKPSIIVTGWVYNLHNGAVEKVDC